MPTKRPVKLGQILKRENLVEEGSLHTALALQKGDAEHRLGSLCLDLKLATERPLVQCLAWQLGVPGVDLSRSAIRTDTLRLLPRKVAERLQVLPLMQEPGRLFLAMRDPHDIAAVDEVRFITGLNLLPHVALEIRIGDAIDGAYDAMEKGEVWYHGPQCERGMAEGPVLVAPTQTAQDVAELPEMMDLDAGAPELAASGAQTTVSQADVEAAVAEALAVPEAAPEPEPAAPAEPAPIPEPPPRETTGIPDMNQTATFSVIHSGPLPSHPAPELAPPTAVQGDGPRILVVDDEMFFREMYTDLLGERGYRVETAATGTEGLEKLRQNPPALAILDAMLPGMHGFELCRQAKAAAQLKHVPIIMVTGMYKGWRFGADIKRNYGADEVLEKPVKEEVLMRRIAELLEAAGSAAPSAPNADDVARAVEDATRAGVAAMQAGKLDEALDHFHRGLDSDPFSASLHFYAGNVHFKCGRVYDAMSEYERAVDLDATLFPAAKNLAILYERQGFRYKAFEMWERALRSCSDERTRSKIEKRLRDYLDTGGEEEVEDPSSSTSDASESSGDAGSGST